MTKKILFMNNIFLPIAIVLCAISGCSGFIPDKQLCSDPECSEPVSLAKTTLKYTPSESGILSFNANVNAKVYSKGTGKRTDLWGVEINGKRGFAPKTFLREYKIIQRDLKYEVPIQPRPNDNVKHNVKKSKTNDKDAEIHTSAVTSEETHTENNGEKENLNGATPVYEVLDGTTINVFPKASVQPSFVTEGVESITVTSGEQNDIPGVDTLHADSNETIFIKTDEKASVDIQQNVEEKENGFSANTETKPLLHSSKVEVDAPDLSGIPTDIPMTISNVIEKENDIDSKHIKQTETTDQQENVYQEQQNLEAQASQQNDSSPEFSNVNKIELPNKVSVSQPDDGDSLLKNKSNHDELLSKEEPENIVQQESNIKKNYQDNLQKNDSEIINGTTGSESIINSSTHILAENHTYSQQDLTNETIQHEYIPNTEPLAYQTNVTDAPPSNENVINQPHDDMNSMIQEIKNEGIQLEERQKQDITTERLEHKTVSTDEPLSKENITPPESDINSVGQELKNETIQLEERQKEDITTESVEHQVISTDAALSKEIVISQPDGMVTALENQTAPEELVNKETLENVATEAHANINNDTYMNLTTVKQENNEVPIQESSQLESKTEFVQSDLIQESLEVVDVVQLNTNESSIGNVSTAFTESQINNTVPLDATVFEEVQTAMPDVGNVSHGNVLEEPVESDSHETDGKASDAGEGTIMNAEHNFLNNTESVEEKSSITSDEILNLEHSEDSLHSSQANLISEHSTGFNEFRNRNLLNAGEDEQYTNENVFKENTHHLVGETLPESGDDEDNVDDTTMPMADALSSIALEAQSSSPDVCVAEHDACTNTYDTVQQPESDDDAFQTEDNAIMSRISMEQNYWLTLMYVSTTAVTVLVFCLGYYYIENMRRDSQLIAKINKLEKDLLITTKECTVLTENLTLTKEKLTCIEDESFGSNEMVLSLKADLDVSQNVKAELEDQITMLEKDLESATEAGLELERMLREVLSSNNEVNPLAESVEDLQGRLNAQRAENESLISALNIKIRENEVLQLDLANVKKTLEEFENESTEMTVSLKEELEAKNGTERTLTDKVQRLEMQLKEISTQKAMLQKELKSREVELEDLGEVVTQLNCNNLDLDKLYDVSRIKAEATAVLEERNELRIRLSEVEGAHNLLEEHMKLVREEISSLSEQCKLAEKEKKDAETRLEVLTNFFNEKETQRQKEEAIWLQKQGEVVSTVERIQSMQNEIENYKQQIEMLRPEILDQEREYKSQISLLETKAHEQWVVARQVERRLEESKVEAGQLRNRLTLIEKNINDTDPESKLHRLEANGDTATSPPPLFIGPDSSSSPIMFSGPSGVLPPPPPPSYMHHSIFPPYMPPPLHSGGVPPFEVGQRPPPLGGRLSSPPPIPLPGSASSRYDNAASPPPMSPHLLPPYNHRSPPPPFGNDHLHPLPPGSLLLPPLGSTHSWGEETLPPLRNSSFHPHQREQRVRNHKGSLHSSGESLDRSHHNSKV